MDNIGTIGIIFFNSIFMSYEINISVGSFFVALKLASGMVFVVLRIDLGRVVV